VAKKQPERVDPNSLPRPVSEMIDAMWTAVHSGRIEDLQTALDWNELPPILSEGKVDDPVRFLKASSADGEGRQILAVLANMLAAGATKLPLGRDPENADVYVWPYLAELDFDALNPGQLVELYRIVPAEVVAEMRSKKRWTWYRVVIGADGTWHSFTRHD